MAYNYLFWEMPNHIQYRYMDIEAAGARTTNISHTWQTIKIFSVWIVMYASYLSSNKVWFTFLNKISCKENL